MAHPLHGITRLGYGPRISSNPPPHAPVSLQNRVRVQVVGPNEDGEIVTKRDVDRIENIMLTQGLNSLCQMIGSGTAAASDWIAAIRIGTDNTAAASTQTGCIASTASLPVGASFVRSTGSAARILQYKATFESNNPAGAAAINEIGLYYHTNAASGACRTMLGTDSVNKGASDVINVTYEIQFNTGAAS